MSQQRCILYTSSYRRVDLKSEGVKFSFFVMYRIRWETSIDNTIMYLELFEMDKASLFVLLIDFYSC